MFLKKLIFQLFNHFILPSSMLTKLVKIYIFGCNNKMLFVINSFIGFLVGHIFFHDMGWIGIILDMVKLFYLI
ncbi:hypothetical protein GW17_00029390 [Ensete ventricosum]|nr:hypothetical protein GW17_00029390 [Ensete ventricosum]